MYARTHDAQNIIADYILYTARRGLISVQELSSFPYLASGIVFSDGKSTEAINRDDIREGFQFLLPSLWWRTLNFLCGPLIFDEQQTT